MSTNTSKAKFPPFFANTMLNAPSKFDIKSQAIAMQSKTDPVHSAVLTSSSLSSPTSSRASSAERC